MPDAAVPRPIYTDPEIAGVGLTEAQAVEQLRRRERSRSARFPWVANARAVMSGETAGWVKSIHETTYGELVGVVIVGAHATDLIEAAVVALDAEATIETVADGMAPHPTLSEGAQGGRPRRARPGDPSAAAAQVAHAASVTLRAMKIYTRRNAARRLPHAEGDAARDRQEARPPPERPQGRRVRRPRARLGRDPRRRRSPSRCGAGAGEVAEDAELRRATSEIVGEYVTAPEPAPGDVSHGPGRRRRGRSIRPALDGLVPYEPGKPVEEVQRELGLERVVKLASNEGPYGPFPAAQEAIARATLELNRYPDGGAWRLRSALAERHDVALRAGDRLRRCRCRRRVTSAWRRSTRATRSSPAGRRSRATCSTR